MVRLVCAIVGSEGTDSIDIASSDVVSNLRILIKDRYANTLEKIDAPHLKLFLATKNGAWLPCDDPMALKLERGQVDADIKQAVSGDPLNAAWTIDDVLVANNMTSRAPKSTQIHILVKVPESFSLTKRVRLGEVEDVPQINIHGVDFVTLPAVLLEKCGLERSDLMLYCRDQVHELWDFLEVEVIKKNNR
ncbi:crn1-like protein [Phytophthora cinnamomi]|uniref:crn1-like protein n=1 Tax=Phytophthora cinnamomi TaxID=4785 RepID=UPI002B2C304D